MVILEEKESMHLIIPIILQLYLFPAFINVTNDLEKDSDLITIEILNQQEIPFEFSITFKERRDQVHIRSAVALQSLRIINDEKKPKSYDVRGSNLVMLPRIDFAEGSYIAEFKFQRDPTIIMAKIEVPEILTPSDL